MGVDKKKKKERKPPQNLDLPSERDGTPKQDRKLLGNNHFPRQTPPTHTTMALLQCTKAEWGVQTSTFSRLYEAP